MTEKTRLDVALERLFAIYGRQGVPIAKPRAFALRLLEEAVELALACGASVGDTHSSVVMALTNEQKKDPRRDYDEERVETYWEIAGELADICVLTAATASVANVIEDDVELAIRAKIDRLEAAAHAGMLHFTADGRFYRRSTEKTKPAHYDEVERQLEGKAKATS